MNEPTNIDNCERAGELVSYFYGEATRVERESFDAHLARCVACREELAAFAEVREAVGHWRAEILNHAATPSFAGTFAPSLAGAFAPETRRETASVRAVPERSARAALRQFFALSPVWLRAGMAAAAVVVCALLALAAFNTEVRTDGGGLAFSTRFQRSETQDAPPSQAFAPAGKTYTQAEMDKLVAERDAALLELEDTRAQLDNSREANLIAAVETLEPASSRKTHSTPDASPRARRAAPAPRPKRLRNERDEEDAPRLYDLLIEAN
ncbi:MAG TPA: hypothetical protein VEX70_12750 [Pyrinomonadaceae bacterium]|nr:hypothetical protein [Pyrinomonadaceae bacterium]